MTQEEFHSFSNIKQDTLRVIKSSWDFSRYSTETFYACLATPFRISTFLRRLDRRETILQRDIKITPAVEYGFLTGAAAFCLTVYQGIDYEITQAANGNYIPALSTAATLVLTNMGSFAYEKYYKSQEKKRSLEEIALDSEPAQ